MAKNSIEKALALLEAEKSNLSADNVQRLAELINAVKTMRGDVADTLGKSDKRQLSPKQQSELLSALESRLAEEFQHYQRPERVNFEGIKRALKANPALMYSLAQMENSGGMPDIFADQRDAFIFADLSAETPERRRGLTYDEAIKMAKEFGVEMVSDDVYRIMQEETGEFDTKTTSWLATSPADLTVYYNLATVGFNRGRLEITAAEVTERDEVRGWRGVLRVPKV